MVLMNVYNYYSPKSDTMKTTALKTKILFTLSFMFLLSFLFVAYQAKGQHKHDPEKFAKKQTEWMKTELSLSDDQTSKVESIHVDYAKKKKALKEEMRKQMRILEQDKQKDLSTVLTKEQLSQYETKKAEMKANRKQGHRKGKEGCQEKKTSY